MNKAYSRINFENLPSHATPLSATNLNIMDKALDDIDDRVVELHDDLTMLDLQLTGNKIVNFMPPNLASTSHDIMVDSDNTIRFNPSSRAAFLTSKDIYKSTFVALAIWNADMDWEHITMFSFNYGNPEEEVSLVYDSDRNIYYAVLPECESSDNEGKIAILIEASSELNTTDYTNTMRLCPFACIEDAVESTDIIDDWYIRECPYIESNSELTNDVADIKKEITEAERDITSIHKWTHTDPYLYKLSGDDAVYDKLIGCSFGVNQLVQNGNFADTSNWTVGNATLNVSSNEATLTATGSGNAYLAHTFSPIINHIYYMAATMKCTSGAVDMQVGNAYKIYSDISSNYTQYAKLLKPTGTNPANYYFTGNNCSNGDIFNIKNAQLIDLTLMFGTEIADKAYTMEQATAGSGIAWLKSYGFDFSKYEPYNPGSLQSVKTSGKKVVGFNQWDEETRNGLYIDGVFTAAPSYIANKNIIPILPNTQYYIHIRAAAGRSLYFYDRNGNYINRQEYYSDTVFTTPANAYYMNFNLGSLYGSTYNHDICINISDTSKNGTYEPYTSTTYSLGNDDLRGILQLSNNKLVYNGDIKTSDGMINRKYGIVDLGSVSDWVYVAPTEQKPIPQFYPASSMSGIGSSVSTNCVCSIYVADEDSVGSRTKDKTCCLFNNRVYICDSAYSDATTFKTALQNSNAQLVYEKATPTTEQSTPFTNPQIVYSDGTEEYIDTRDVPIPVGHESEYIDIPEWMENKYFNDVRRQASEGENTKQIVNIINSRTRENITNRLGDLPKAVAEQNLEKYGYKIGDYFERVDGNRTYTYIIADYNTFKGTLTPYCLTTNHIGIVVDTKVTSQWYSGDASSVGYNGSTLHTYLKGTVLDNIKSDFIALFGGSTGLEHLLSHSKLLTTALANWGWQANQYISALSEVQTIGSVVWGANGYQTGEASKKLELFDKYKWTELFESRYPWLRDLYTSTSACFLYDRGNELDGGVTNGNIYVIGLINFY